MRARVALILLFGIIQPFIPNYIMFFIGIVLIIGGILNLNAGAKMTTKSTMDKQPEQDKTATP